MPLAHFVVCIKFHRISTDSNIPRIAVPFERRVFRGYVTGFHEPVLSKGGLTQTARRRLR